MVDASVMPRIVSGNTQWPVMAIAEKMADAIIRDAKLQRADTRQLEGKAKL